MEDSHHTSPLRQKLKKKVGTYRSTGRLHTRDTDRVHGNRHVGGHCLHMHGEKKPRPPHQRSTSPSGLKKKKHKYVVLSPSRKHDKMNSQLEADYANYRNLVE